MAMSEKRRAQLMAGPYTRLLAEHEDLMAVLYNTFANSISSAKAFWQTMSAEETGHRKMILKIDEKLQSGEWKFKRPKFVTSAIIDSLEWIASRKQGIETTGISMRDALKMAVNLESGMIESAFFDVLGADNAEMIEAVEAQAAYTRAHIRRLQNEAKRLKWRIFGREKLRPKGGASTLTPAELRANIKASQANMLGLLISMEEAASGLYNTYSGKLEDFDNNMWAKLGAEEMEHVSMLKQLYRILENGKVFYNIDRFNKRALEEMIEFIQNEEFNARHKKLSQNQAISIALKIERSMLERGFYSVVTSDAPEFQIISRRLIELTNSHTARLETEKLRCANLMENFLMK